MRSGFSLVELSIVLVILGLLTGGILTGQNLIRAAELRSLTTQTAQIQAAYHTFSGKYFAKPGDMRNATDFWGSAGGTGADNTCWAAQTQSAASTCNGNGDGALTGVAVVGNIRENFLAWKHLANAGLVEGSYLGRSNAGVTGGVCAAGGVDCPLSRVSNVLVNVYYNTLTKRNHIIFQDVSESPQFLPEEVWNMDKKLDDGLPHTGRIFSSGEASCATSNDITVLTAAYNLSETGKVCKIRAAVLN